MDTLEQDAAKQSQENTPSSLFVDSNHLKQVTERIASTFSIDFIAAFSEQKKFRPLWPYNQNMLFLMKNEFFGRLISVIFPYHEYQIPEKIPLWINIAGR